MNDTTRSPTRLGLAAAIAITLALPTVAAALAPETTDAKVIMQAVEDRATLDKVRVRIQMTITDKSGSTRSRVVQSRTMKFTGGTKQVLFFESPADVRNTAMLSVDWDDGAKDDDQWLWLPSLHKATRISGGDRSGAFMGSDFSYADMTKKDPKQYDYKIVKQSAKVRGEECWVIEARPRSDKEMKETGYVKSLVWVSKSKLLPVQMKTWVREGKKLKFMIAEELKQVGGVWIPHKMTMRTVQGREVQSTTVLSFVDYKANQADVKESDFTQRRLEQGL